MKALPNCIIEVDAIQVIEGKESHAYYLSSRLRKNDLREVWLSDSDPLQALLTPIVDKEDLNATTYTATVGGEPICMFGTVKATDNQAVVWALGSDKIFKYRKSFVKASIEVVNLLQNNYEKIWNVVPYDHLDTIIWLKKLGFIIENDFVLQKNVPMLHFFRCKNLENMATVH